MTPVMDMGENVTDYEDERDIKKFKKDFKVNPRYDPNQEKIDWRLSSNV